MQAPDIKLTKKIQPTHNDTIDKSFYVPEIDNKYYAYHNFNIVKQIVESGKFYPIWITGLSGNGKTKMVEQACAQAGLPANFRSLSPEEKKKVLENHQGREFIRVNFTTETDEGDLIGHYTLIDGTMVYNEGPVVEALRRGAVLLLDEIDVGHTNKIMCLQSILEGKGVLIKEKKEWVHPAPGFQVFATSNTKGKGSSTGQFIGTSIMNSAFLDRFVGMIEQDYPPVGIEENILIRYYAAYNITEKGRTTTVPGEKEKIKLFCSNLCRWAAMIRDNYSRNTTTEVITTRTLINIIKGYSIFEDEMMAIKLACQRYDDHVAESFISFYEKVISDGTAVKSSTTPKPNTPVDDDIPF